MSHSVDIAFMPLDYVTVTLFALKYHGRINQVVIKPNVIMYEVEYADDKGDLQMRIFNGDELQVRA